MQFELTREYIDQLKKIIEEKKEAEAIGLMKELHPADIAEIYDELSIEEAKFLYLCWMVILQLMCLPNWKKMIGIDF